ncbi:hypothetical protein [Sphingobacterium paucimobilis]|uniref:HTH cro/C1-type domain-containing protein n=1 Tax=Sphingobacterium paucimobilis HER1398 TaxID=1346330 RepID=U2HVS2_9SPHI|nr:hypothetical protein [Sphingobacterium paucimobilis]ERJ59617.1 hypothetical protein M472_12625 [Sphingobacterium paucimobilis HER1398]
MDTARKRIIDFIENQSIRPKDFLLKTGLAKGFVDRSHQKSGISDINLSKILESYPELNAEWLVTGKGSMLKPNKTDVLKAPLVSHELEPNTMISLLQKQLVLLEETKELQSEKIVRLEKELADAKRGI